MSLDFILNNLVIDKKGDIYLKMDNKKYHIQYLQNKQQIVNI